MNVKYTKLNSLSSFTITQIQSSTQATNAERAGQVPYARAKAMADFSLANMDRLPTSIILLGLLFSKDNGLIGQQGSDLDLADLVTFPLTPIMVPLLHTSSESP